MAKKRSLHAVNEYFEPVFNAAAATQIVFQQPARATQERNDLSDAAPEKQSLQSDQKLDQQALLDALNQTMPFGRYKGTRLLDLPEPYLVWFHRQGFPPGKLGQQLALLYEIKANGLETMLYPLRQRGSGQR